MNPFVDADWLEKNRSTVKLADVRWYLDGRSGMAAYKAGHIPGAVFVDLEECLTTHTVTGRGRHPLPPPEIFAEGMSRAGIQDRDTVVAYDDAGGVIAARLVWLLRVLGHDAAILAGGLSAFKGELSTTPATPHRADFTPSPWPSERLATIEDARDRKNFVVDARDSERYRGDSEPIDPRAGHIPGARSVPCRENLTAEGLLLAPETIRENFLRAGVTDGNRVVSYCGSGITACHNLLTLEYAGLGLGRLFPGSWSEYSARTDLEVATGDLP